jgi:hypothetical protein
MPQPIFHLYLAERPAIQYAVGELKPEARNALLHGALAPDTGFFPGGDARLSLLAHHSRNRTCAAPCFAGLNSLSSLRSLSAG